MEHFGHAVDDAKGGALVDFVGDEATEARIEVGGEQKLLIVDENIAPTLKLGCHLGPQGDERAAEFVTIAKSGDCIQHGRDNNAAMGVGNLYKTENVNDLNNIFIEDLTDLKVEDEVVDDVDDANQVQEVGSLGSAEVDWQ